MVGEPKGKAAEYFKPYEEYSKVLRTWFVAFGIGAPVLLLTNERIAEAIKASGEARGVVSLFARCRLAGTYCGTEQGINVVPVLWRGAKFF